jgi:hypothetical protein
MTKHPRKLTEECLDLCLDKTDWYYCSESLRQKPKTDQAEQGQGRVIVHEPTRPSAASKENAYHRGNSKINASGKRLTSVSKETVEDVHFLQVRKVGGM